MKGDSVLEELWRVKEAHAAKYDYDVRAMGKALMAQQDKSGRKVVSPGPRPATRTEAS